MSSRLWIVTIVCTVSLCIDAHAAFGASGGRDLVLEHMKNVAVMIEGKIGASTREGAGIIAGADERGLVIVTADHVVREGDEAVRDLRVRLRWSPQLTVPATLLPERIPRSHMSATGPSDLAVLRIASSATPAIDADSLPFERIAEPQTLERGEDLSFVGYAEGRPWWVNVTSAKFAATGGASLFFETASLQAGYSGGPLLDSELNVAGMVIDTGGTTGSALHISVIVAQLEAWRMPVRLGKMPRPSSFISVSAGYLFTCGVGNNGFGYCWSGENSPDRTTGAGRAATANVAEFWRIEGGLRFKSLSVGSFHACGVTTAAEGFCFGSNREEQLGTASDEDFSQFPSPVAGSHRFRAIAAGYGHTCAITTESKALCWGELGFFPTSKPTPVAGALVFQSITSGSRFSCALADGRVYCWGDNVSNQLGVSGPKVFSWNPIHVEKDLTFREVSAGRAHACGLTTSNDAVCWGDPSYRQLGTRRGSRGPVEGGRKFSSITAGDEFSCGIVTAGHAHCWGNGTYGALGNGWRPSVVDGLLQDDLRDPVPVSTDVRFRAIAAGKAQFACGIALDGQVHCWGAMKRRGQQSFGDYGSIPHVLPITVAATPPR
jgi:hypothetical protein